MGKTAAAAPDVTVKHYEKLIATVPEAIRKGASVPYTSVNGNMFSYLSKDGKLAVRLPEKERGEFLQKYKASLCSAYGIVQKEYVEVPDALLSRTSELKAYFTKSFKYASSLKSKKTAK